MNLQQIADDLKKKISNGALTLDNSIIKQESFAFVLSFFDNNSISLTGLTDPDNQIKITEKVLTISANQTLFQQALHSIITLTETSDTVLKSDYSTSFSKITFSDLISWKIIPTAYFDAAVLPTLPFIKTTMTISSTEMVQTWMAVDSANTLSLIDEIGLKISSIGFTVNRAPNPLSSEFDTTFSLSGTFELGKTNLSVTVVIPTSISTPKGQWSLSLSSTTTLAEGIGDLTQLVFGNNLFASLPPGFQDALSFTLDQLLIVFSLSKKAVKYIKIVITRPKDKPWTVVDNFTIKEAGATFSLSKMATKFSLDTLLFGKFQIGADDAPTKVLLNVSLSIPSGQNDWLAQIDGAIQNNNIDQVFKSLPASEGQSLPAFPVGLTLEEITLNYLNISFNPDSKTLTYISFNVTSVLDLNIFDIFHIQNPHVALDIQNPTLSTQRTLTGSIGGTLIIANVAFDLLADKPSSDTGWTFSAAMRTGSKIPLLDMVKAFLKTLNITKLPEWVEKASLDITKVKLAMYVPTKDAPSQNKKYHVEGTVEWAVAIDSFKLPQLTATVVMDYEDGKASGNIAVNAEFLGLPFKVGYKFGTPDTEVYLEWLGIQADYKSNSVTKIDVITITFANMSLGEIVTHLIASFEPGFTLPPPWDVLNAINLSGLSLVYTRNGKDENEDKLVIKYAKKISLAFIEIDEVTLTKDKQGVFIGFKGKFLGIPITSDAPDPDVKKLAGKGSDVRDIGGIPVPAMGKQYFDLDYIGLGQKVALYPTKDLKTVDEALNALKTVFGEPIPPAPGQPPVLPIKVTPKTPEKSMLIFSEESSWLIASKFTVIEAITIGFIFNDPNLYGLLIKLEGDKVKALSGLSFQILYKKVTDSVGVYQIELKLPDAIRQLEFGAVSITLPIIAVDIYTNGSFRVDFGFPKNLDFSRSFSIQAFPFTGSGGFYFAYLKDVPSDNVPTTDVGNFNPIIEFGIGLTLGVGKSINKGILKAGFSITVAGILEGVVAPYTPNNPSYPGKGDTYYKISATVGIIGKLYGEINFAIISASLDITVYAYVQMVIEAYRKIPIYLEAGVSVSLRVKINLGIFKITIKLHFSMTISASFTIGSDSQAPWDYIPPGTNGGLEQGFALEQNATCGPVKLKWQPLILTKEEQEGTLLSLYFFPQLTVANTGNKQTPQIANLLYIDAPESGTDAEASLNRFVKGVLYWCINSGINSHKSDTTLASLKTETVTLDILKQLLAYLTDTEKNPSPVPYANIEAFLKAYFTINITDPETAVLSSSFDEDVPINASIFPLFPSLNISWNLNGTTEELKTYTADESYMETVTELLRKMQVDYQNNLEKAGDALEEKSHGVIADGLMDADAASQPMSAFIFQDYFLMIAKAALQDAIDEFEKFTYPISGQDSLDTIVKHFNQISYVCNDETNDGEVITNSLTPKALAMANGTIPFNKDLTLKIPGLSYQIKHEDTFQSIANLYAIQIAQLDNDDNINIQGLVAADTVVQVDGFVPYRVAVGQTIQQIAKDMKAEEGEDTPTALQVIVAIASMPVLLSLAKLTLPEIDYTTKATDSFESVSVFYGISIEDLATNATNVAIPNLFNASAVSVPSLQVLGVTDLVNTFDTSDNIARISGMTSRYFLHGMRLPVPQDLQTVSALYLLSAQQFAVPLDIKVADKFSIQLNRTEIPEGRCWLKLNDSCTDKILDIEIKDTTISRILDLATIQLDPDTVPLPPQPLPLGKVADETFTLKPGFGWQYPGSLQLPIGTPPDQLVTEPSIWNFSEALISKLIPVQESGDTDLGLEVIKLVKDESDGFKKQGVNYAFSTLVEVSIQELTTVSNEPTVLENAYEVIGANDTSIVLLERLIQYMNSNVGGDNFIQEIQVLYAPNSTGDTPNGLQSAVNGDVTIALVQANLSTETNPTSFAEFNADNALDKRNTLNSFKEFISYLWQCSIVRTGGYFLYYKTSDGNGLPSSLFSESNTGKINVLITYKDSISYNFVNSVAIADTIDKSNTTVYIQADKLSALVAVTPPGNVGFQLERSKPEEYTAINPYPIPATLESKQQDTNYLNHQYNLIGYQIIENDIYTGVYSLLPVGPLHEPGDDDLTKLKALPSETLLDENWKYNSLIPLAKNVKEGQRIVPEKPTYPPASEDPYAGLGSDVKVRLNWQDMLGNTLHTTLSDGNHDITVSNLYSDNLYPVSQWPSASMYYSFPTVGESPQLRLDLVFDPSRYTVSTSITKEDAIKNAEIDRVIYQKIYYQLIQKDINIEVESSINEEAGQNKFPVKASVLNNFVGEIWEYLNAVVEDPSAATPPANISIENSIQLQNTNRIFELTVQLTISRTSHIDPLFASVPAVHIAHSFVRPVTKASKLINASGDEDDIISLTPFATEFEATFKDLPVAGNFLKVATGLDRMANDSEDNKMWVIHFDIHGKDGIYFKIDNSQQYFYSPTPLANSLETYDKVNINQYKSGEKYPFGSPQLKTFSEVDLDSWGKICLEAIDLFLTAEYATPAYLIDNGIVLQKILDAKELIAEGITESISNIIAIEEPDHSSLANAKEKMKQQLLIKLANSYKINTIVQNAATISNGFEGKNVPTETPPFVPKIYGDMVGELQTAMKAKYAVLGEGENLSEEYTLSTAKIPLGDGTSWLTYFFEAKEVEKHSSFMFKDMSFKISHIEHQIAAVENMGDYRASSWLTLIVPLDASMSEVGPVQIPVALRSYPTPPSLTNQSIEYKLSGGAEKVTTLEESVLWGYEFNYLPPIAGQDQISAALTFNNEGGPDPLKHMFYNEDGSYNSVLLPATLAQFISVYPSIKKDMVNVLLKTPHDPIAVNAVEAFATLISNVGAAWKNWSELKQNYEKEKARLASELPKITYDYDIVEEPKQPGVGGSNLVVKVLPLDSAPALNLNLPGYLSEDHMFYKLVDGEKVFLTYDERQQVLLRNLSIANLNILEKQNAWAGVLLVRNKDLIENPDGTFKTTNKAFIYKTPLVKFFNELVPLLVCNETIKIAEIEKPNKPADLYLAKHLQNLFKTLLQNSYDLNQTIKVECLYQYNIKGTDSFNQIEIPILLATPLLFVLGKDWEIGTEGSYCKEATSFVCNLSNTILKWFLGNKPNTNNGKLRFVIEIFNKDNDNLPILKLENLSLDITYVKDIKTTT